MPFVKNENLIILDRKLSFTPADPSQSIVYAQALEEMNDHKIIKTIRLLGEGNLSGRQLWEIIIYHPHGDEILDGFTQKLHKKAAGIYKRYAHRGKIPATFVEMAKRCIMFGQATPCTIEAYPKTGETRLISKIDGTSLLIGKADAMAVAINGAIIADPRPHKGKESSFDWEDWDTSGYSLSLSQARSICGGKPNSIFADMVKIA